MSLLNIFSSNKEKLDKFLVLEIGLEKVTAAVFDHSQPNTTPQTSEENVSIKTPKLLGIGRKNIPAVMDLPSVTEEAIEAVSATVKELPQTTVLGVSAEELETSTTIVRYQRADASSKIDSNEIEQIIEHSGKEKSPTDKKLFFATVTSTLIDGTLVSNPIGLTGQSLEVSCFNAFKPEQELAFYSKVLNDLDLKLLKIIPTSYAVARSLIKNGIKDAILICVGLEHTEVIFVSNAHVVGIKSFDLGSKTLDFWSSGLEVVLEEFKEHQPWPDAVKIYGESEGQEKIKSELLTFPWMKKFELDHFPKIEVMHYQGEGLENDLGVAALSLEV
ncbi:MAG: hypothetical protein M1150_02135 [Patescibacteria group bacterium]|nr:hypothetical protein [Patescibacteria group bacterium]